MEISYRHLNYSMSIASFATDFPVLQSKNYILKLAVTEEELESVLRLRFQVFNVELRLGFSNSSHTQMDRDKFDRVCHHLMLIAKSTGQTIGTYRMQSYAMASQGLGFDAADIFDLNGIPNSVLRASVEVGRACIAKEYRNSQALLCLWEGLANYLVLSQSKYFFGCASLLTQNPLQASCAYHYFRQHNLMHPSILVYPNPGYTMAIHQDCPHDCQVNIPKIVQAYLNIGAKICSLPAIDQQFNTIDFLTVSNIDEFARWHSHIPVKE